MTRQGTSATLPGGLLDDGRIEREAVFRPITGRLEQEMLELEESPERYPVFVTTVLSSVLERIGSRPVGPSVVQDLCIADRQYLMSRLGALLTGELTWLKVLCAHCEEPFDVDIRRCELPIKPAGQGYPQSRLALPDRSVTVDLRVPTGADQEAIATVPEDAALPLLLERCVTKVDGAAPPEGFVQSLCAAEIAAIDDALDDASPALCDRLLLKCPECGASQYSALNHYTLAGLDEHRFFDEVHTLASCYHWSEASILDLPRARRRRYLRLIEQSNGVSAGE